jgi:hypothetical protein
LIYGSETDAQGIPKVFTIGRRHVHRFAALNGSYDCREILVNDRNVLPCTKAIGGASGLLMNLISGGSDDSIPEMEADRAATCKKLLRAFDDAGFHCAHSVLEALSDVVVLGDDLLSATIGYVGGALCLGRTCSALTAGVLAVGARCGGVEESYWRVLKLVCRMVMGLDAAGDHLNAANRALNMGGRLILV